MTTSNLLLRHDDAEKYMDSEVDLSEHITKFKALAAAPQLYKDFMKL